MKGQFNGLPITKTKKVFYLDTETTGVNCEVHDIVQLAFVIEINNKEVERGNLFMRPFNVSTIHPEALAKQNRTLEEVKEFPDPKEAYASLNKTLAKYVDKYDKGDKFTPAGYNVRFDADFLNQFFKRNGDKYYGSYFNWKLIDPYPFLHWLDGMDMISLPDYKLGTVCRYFGIDLKAHDALEDINATKKLITLLREKYIAGGKLSGSKN